MRTPCTLPLDPPLCDQVWSQVFLSATCDFQVHLSQVLTWNYLSVLSRALVCYFPTTFREIAVHHSQRTWFSTLSRCTKCSNGVQFPECVLILRKQCKLVRMVRATGSILRLLWKRYVIYHGHKVATTWAEIRPIHIWSKTQVYLKSSYYACMNPLNVGTSYYSRHPTVMPKTSITSRAILAVTTWSLWSRQWHAVWPVRAA